MLRKILYFRCHLRTEILSSFCEDQFSKFLPSIRSETIFFSMASLRVGLLDSAVFTLSWHQKIWRVREPGCKWMPGQGWCWRWNCVADLYWSTKMFLRMYLPASGNPNRNTGTRATLATENRLMSMRTLLAHDLGEASSPSSVLDLSLAMSSLSASCVVPVSRPSSMKRMFPLWL